jgi:hypothetical protein
LRRNVRPAGKENGRKTVLQKWPVDIHRSKFGAKIGKINEE